VDLVVSGLLADGSAAVVARGGLAAKEHGQSSRPGGTTGAAGGPRIIATHSEVCPDSNDALRGRLGPVSRRSPAEVGHLSSASVLHVMEMMHRQCPQPAGSYGLMIGLGPRGHCRADSPAVVIGRVPVKVC